MSASRWLIPFALFVLLASPATFKAVRGVAGGWVASAEGQAKFAGLLLHAVIFVGIVGFLMRRVSFYSHANTSYKTEVHRGPRLGGEWEEKVTQLDADEFGPEKQQMFNLSPSPF